MYDFEKFLNTFDFVRTYPDDLGPRMCGPLALYNAGEFDTLREARLAVHNTQGRCPAVSGTSSTAIDEILRGGKWKAAMPSYHRHVKDNEALLVVELYFDDWEDYHFCYVKDGVIYDSVDWRKKAITYRLHDFWFVR